MLESGQHRFANAPLQPRKARLHARSVEFGFADDLAGYLRDAYERRHLPVLARTVTR